MTRRRKPVVLTNHYPGSFTIDVSNVKHDPDAIFDVTRDMYAQNIRTTAEVLGDLKGVPHAAAKRVGERAARDFLKRTAKKGKK